MQIAERTKQKVRISLRAEAAGILADLVRGCMEWQREGLAVPARLEQATQEWRNECDDASQFIEERCVKAVQARATVGALHAAYREWGGAIRTPKAFGQALDALGYARVRLGGKYYVQSVGLAAQEGA